MSAPVSHVVNALHEALNRASGNLLVRDAEFGDTLRLGQIIKGRVLREYATGRYLMDFGGQQKVVDSSIPLKVAEAFDSRVVALGDRVHLQRLNAAAESATDMARTARAVPGGRAEQSLVTLFAQFNTTLTPAELATAAKAVRQSANAGLMAHSALLLHKLGLPMSPPLLQAIYVRLLGGAPSRVDADAAPRLASGAEPATQTLDRLGALLSNALGAMRPDDVGALRQSQSTDLPSALPDAQDSAEFDAHQDGQADQGNKDWLLGQWLLGVQSHPRIAHRLFTLPIWFGERLVEVSVALYSEQGPETVASALHYRRVVFFVSVEHLGKVQITVHAIDRQLRLEIAADSERATDTLARHVGALRQALNEMGWQIDDVRYVQADLDGDGAVLGSVVHHHISQHSLSRLM